MWFPNHQELALRLTRKRVFLKNHWPKDMVGIKGTQVHRNEWLFSFGSGWIFYKLEIDAFCQFLEGVFANLMMEGRSPRADLPQFLSDTTVDVNPIRHVSIMTWRVQALQACRNGLIHRICQWIFAQILINVF